MKKRLAIIGSKTFKQSTINAMTEEAKKKFETVVFAPINELIIQNIDGKTSVLFKSQNLLNFDAIYPRISSRDMLLGETLLKAIEKAKHTVQ